jgi:hypothetical protein
MTENMQADSVQSRQAGFVRCCLKAYLCSMYEAKAKGNTAQNPPDGFVLNLLAYFPSSCTEIP